MPKNNYLGPSVVTCICLLINYLKISDIVLAGSHAGFDYVYASKKHVSRVPQKQTNKQNIGGNGWFFGQIFQTTSNVANCMHQYNIMNWVWNRNPPIHQYRAYQKWRKGRPYSYKTVAQTRIPSTSKPVSDRQGCLFFQRVKIIPPPYRDLLKSFPQKTVPQMINISNKGKRQNILH